MKKVILLSILVGATQLISGPASSKPDEYEYLPLPSEYEYSPLLSEDERSDEQKPFGGKQWKSVHITDRNTVYTSGDKKIEKWNFRGSTKPIEVTSDLDKNATVQFTDNNAYRLHAGMKEFVKYAMNGGIILEDHSKMKNKIKQLSVSNAGCAILTEDGRITREDSDSNPEGIFPASATDRITLLDTGELLYVHQKVIKIFDTPTPRNIAPDISPKKILRKKTQTGHIVLASQNEKNQPAIDIVVVADGKSILTIPTLCYPLDWDLEGNNIAIVGDGSGKNSTVKLFDIENDGKKIYEGNHDISGHRAVRLDGSTIYFVGDKPEPKSLGIDTREKSNKN